MPAIVLICGPRYDLFGPAAPRKTTVFRRRTNRPRHAEWSRRLRPALKTPTAKKRATCAARATQIDYSFGHEMNVIRGFVGRLDADPAHRDFAPACGRNQLTCLVDGSEKIFRLNVDRFDQIIFASGAMACAISTSSVASSNLHRRPVSTRRRNATSSGCRHRQIKLSAEYCQISRDVRGIEPRSQSP